jgi:hypothetical protein
VDNRWNQRTEKHQRLAAVVNSRTQWTQVVRISQNSSASPPIRADRRDPGIDRRTTRATAPRRLACNGFIDRAVFELSPAQSSLLRLATFPVCQSATGLCRLISHFPAPQWAGTQSSLPVPAPSRRESLPVRTALPRISPDFGMSDMRAVYAPSSRSAHHAPMWRTVTIPDFHSYLPRAGRSHECRAGGAGLY